MQAKPGSASPGRGKASSITETDGFAIDIEEAKVLRDIEHRLSVFLRKRYAPSENGGPLTAAETVEESELRAMFSKRVAALPCPVEYGPDDAMKDSNRLHQLNCKRLRPPSCGGRELKVAEDEEEAILTARLSAYRHSPEGRDRERMLDLKLKDIDGCRSVDEQNELDQLKAIYPEGPSDSSLAKAIDLRLAELSEP
jgi:hypothetical protein